MWTRKAVVLVDGSGTFPPPPEQDTVPTLLYSTLESGRMCVCMYAKGVSGSCGPGSTEGEIGSRYCCSR